MREGVGVSVLVPIKIAVPVMLQVSGVTRIGVALGGTVGVRKSQ